MRYLPTYLFVIVLLFSLFSCNQDDLFDIETNYASDPLRITGSYNGPDETGFVDFEIEIGAPDLTIFEEYFYWNADVSEGELGSTLIIGAYTSKNTLDPVSYFGLQFWSDELPANRQWTKAELEDFFAIGNSFELGQGANLVDVSFRYPGVDDFGILDDISSKSSFLSNPQGQLIVTKVEDFSFDGTRPNTGAVYDGLLISCVVNAEVGLNRDKSNWRNSPESLATDEVIELREVELTFFVGE